MSETTKSKSKRADEAIDQILDDYEDELTTVRDAFGVENGDVSVNANPITNRVTVSIQTDIDLSEYL